MFEFLQLLWWNGVNMGFGVLMGRSWGWGGGGGLLVVGFYAQRLNHKDQTLSHKYQTLHHNNHAVNKTRCQATKTRH